MQTGGAMDVRDLDVCYDHALALRGVGFVVPQGGLIGIVGPNGSGKSTLIRALSRTLPPAAGQVLLHGRNLYRMSAREAAQRIAVVPQESAVGFQFTVSEVVLMGRSPHLGWFGLESAADCALAEEAMRLTGVWDLRDRPMSAVSGGERQRVVIARALAQQPQVLMLDEPTAHLDIQHQLGVLDLVAHLNQTQRLTTLLVMHDLNLAVRYCQRLLLLERGRLLADGAASEVITEENLRSVYGTDVAVHRHGPAGRPFVSLLPHTTAAAVRPGALTVHVIGGAGTASSLVERLAARGNAVSAGVLNVGDSDHAVVERLGLERAEEAPFSSISEEAAADNRRLIAQANVVVVAPAPFGPANVDNLRATREALAAGQRVIVVSQPPIETRDFCDGSAAALHRELLDHGAVDAPSGERVLALIAEWEQGGAG